MIEKCIETAKMLSPTFIVVLGDILHTHGSAAQQAFEMAHDFLDGLTKVAHVYALMGNHDLLDASQFLTKKHFFLPFKRWRNLTIVDEPIAVEEGMYTFVFCPYVPPGRFIEALNTLESNENFAGWETATCIFSHQDFSNLPFLGEGERVGDEWDESYPPVINGHIHTECIFQNIYCPGSALQVDFNEPPDKRVWHVTFDDECQPMIDKIDLEIKNKKQFALSIDEAKKFDLSITKKYYVKLSITATPQEIKLFREHPRYQQLIKAGVKIVFSPTRLEKTLYSDIQSLGKDKTSFKGVFQELLKRKDSQREQDGPSLQEVYDELFEEDDT